MFAVVWDYRYLFSRNFNIVRCCVWYFLIIEINAITQNFRKVATKIVSILRTQIRVNIILIEQFLHGKTLKNSFMRSIYPFLFSSSTEYPLCGLYYPINQMRFEPFIFLPDQAGYFSHSLTTSCAWTCGHCTASDFPV